MEQDFGFGENVALSGDGQLLAVGDRESHTVRIYGLNGSIWELVGTLIPGGFTGSRKGRQIAMSMDGNTVVVAGSGRLVAYRYSTIDSEWQQLGTEFGTVTIFDEYVELSISSDGNTIALGRGVHDLAQVIEWQDGNGWELIFDTSEVFLDDTLGDSVSLSGDGNVIMASNLLTGIVKAWKRN